MAGAASHDSTTTFGIAVATADAAAASAGVFQQSAVELKQHELRERLAHLKIGGRPYINGERVFF